VRQPRTPPGGAHAVGQHEDRFRRNARDDAAAQARTHPSLPEFAAFASRAMAGSLSVVPERRI